MYGFFLYSDQNKKILQIFNHWNSLFCQQFPDALQIWTEGCKIVFRDYGLLVTPYFSWVCSCLPICNNYCKYCPHVSCPPCYVSEETNKLERVKKVCWSCYSHHEQSWSILNPARETRKIMSSEEYLIWQIRIKTISGLCERKKNNEGVGLPIPPNLLIRPQNKFLSNWSKYPETWNKPIQIFYQLWPLSTCMMI